MEDGPGSELPGRGKGWKWPPEHPHAPLCPSGTSSPALGRRLCPTASGLGSGSKMSDVVRASCPFIAPSGKGEARGTFCPWGHQELNTLDGKQRAKPEDAGSSLQVERPADRSRRKVSAAEPPEGPSVPSSQLPAPVLTTSP